ncbi:hypothetical protein AAFC00_006675 [Neodothiora populina]|uniref:ubiquitinyl hydrolase 1 n=1 Tax=Neodothiora populina TaxID=2781224 RepID=A0ABR3PC31_9PEZI
MSFQASGPGKTAPKLISDFYLFDPNHVLKNYNVLVDPPPPWEDGKPLPHLLDSKSCRHEYITEPLQSLFPELDERPRHGTVWKCASVCKKCRLHADVVLDFRQGGSAVCPNAHFPLHHFKAKDSVFTGTSMHFQFTCTSWGCRAALTVTYTIPFMSKETIDLLTNQDNLARRYRAVLEDDPGRKDVVVTTPVEALYRLKRYTDDSLNPTHMKRHFPARNKKFLGAFGQDCNHFLLGLGFKHDETENAREQTWTLPNPGLTADPLQPNPHRKILENLSIELQILLDRWCHEDGIPNPSPRDAWRDSRPDIERLMSAQAYDRLPNRVLSPTEADHPCFGVLGALGDFSDPLIDYAYKRQSTADPDKTPYYFDCLQQLAQGRGSEYLFVRTSEIVSEGVVGKRDLEDAYNDISGTRDLASAKNIDEQYIISLYRATISDCGTEQRAKLRQSLQKIGQSRASKAIMNAASDTVETYDEALSYLGAEQGMGDEAIIALYGTKIGDSPENSEAAQKAVKIIADERKSGALQGFLTTGELSSYEMDLPEACKHLQIEFNPHMDEAVLSTAFDFALMDNPGQRTQQAIAAVRRAMHEPSTRVDTARENWPVGLISHGNTCYLNSLLQYYFTIKPLRDLVLDIDQYKFDLSSHETKSERVQSIHLKRYEIEAYEKFADHLKVLFDRMIKSPSSVVRPDAELVCGAFLKPDEVKGKPIGKEDEPAKSIDADMTGTGQDDKPVEVKDTSLAESMDTTSQMITRPASVASSATLIEEGDSPAVVSTQALLTPPASPKADPPEPQQRPPLPPRPNVEKALTQLEMAEEAAKRQQDVAEVMEDLLRRLRAAIKPEGQDSHGEQVDQLRDLFNMRFSDTILTDGKSQTKEEEDATNILLNVPYEPTDIYSALDRILDLRSDDVAGKPVELYRTFAALPPLLQISIPRIAIADGSAVKVTHSLRLEETLYMDRYCDTPEVLKIRQRCWQTRRTLRSLRAQKELIENSPIKNLSGPEVVDATAKFISGLVEVNTELEELGVGAIGVPTGLNGELESEAEAMRSRLGPIDDEIRRAEASLQGQFDSFRQHKYRLYAVFFHRGGASAGHYWTNMFDFEKNMWREYNDEKVEGDKNADTILNAREWIHGTPTYAVYVRDEVKDAFVDPVCRHPEVEAVTQQDVQMIDNTADWVDDKGKENSTTGGTETTWTEAQAGSPSAQKPPPQGW